MKVTKEYEWNEVVWEKLNVGDTVRLPEFTVPDTTIAGDRVLFFREQTVKDTATVYNIKDDKIYLVFDHALFKSIMDWSNTKEWNKTQLHDYLSGAFTNSMQCSDIPVSEVSLLSKDEVFGKDALPFFKDGRNRIAFEKEESYAVWYWLKYTESAAPFCVARNNGYDSYSSASLGNLSVRPCFIVKKEE